MTTLNRILLYLLAVMVALVILRMAWKDQGETIFQIDHGLYLHASQLTGLFVKLDSMTDIYNKRPNINLYGVISRVENLPGKGYRVTLNTHFPEQKIECVLPSSAGGLTPESYVGLNGCLCRSDQEKPVFKVNRVVFHRLPASNIN